MKAFTEKFLHYLVLILVTIFAVGVMWKLSAKEQLQSKADEVQIRSLPVASGPKSPVTIAPVQLELCEITSTHAGKIQPWETYQIGFPVAGRVVALGTNIDGSPLDDGDRVQAGQVIATMDDRVFRAQKSEAAAQIEQVTSDLQRAQRARKNNRTSVTDSELQGWVTDLARARAQHEIAIKNLDDATLRAPVNAIISKRMIKSGESVSPNQIVFELVENDEVLLVVDVPETQIRELEERMRAVKAGSPSNSSRTSEVEAFRAHVYLEGHDRFGNPWPSLEGEVYRIPEVADERTGLFAVEIRLANPDHLLRPGMVATADIVTANIPGYQIPEAAVIFRQRNAFLFTVDRDTTEGEMMYWQLGPVNLFRARRIQLQHWIDQGEYIVIPQTATPLESVVTRGQFRLADKQIVRIMNLDKLSPQLNLRATASSQHMDSTTEQ